MSNRRKLPRCVRCGATAAEHPGSTFTNDRGTWECPRFETPATQRDRLRIVGDLLRGKR